MRRPVRLLACVLALALPAGALGTWSLRSTQAGVETPRLDLPAHIGDWHRTTEERLEADVFSSVQPDAYLLQRYEAPNRSPIWLYLAVYLGRAGYGRGAHDPEICYPGQGWEIVHSDALSVTVPSGEELVVRALKVQRVQAHETVLYWFQPSDRWPVNGALEQLMRLIDATRGRARYAFVRLSARSGDGSGAAADLRDLAARLAPEVRGALDRLESTP